MAKLKLTPTTNDQLQASGQHDQLQANGQLKITMEPMLPTPMGLPAFPLPPSVEEPPKKKGGRPKKVKEQTVNLAPVEVKKPLKIALIGTAPSSRMLAPYNDPTWTIWGCSPGNMNVLPRCDAWIEVHGTNLLWPENASYSAAYIKWMSELKVPVYMQDQQLVPHALTIPKEALIKEFGPYFFTSSFAWMMGMAIMVGATEVALYGIDMASRDEYIIQRPGAYHFFMEGARRGVKIWAPYESDIMQPPPLYGYSDVGPFCRKMLARTAELKERLAPMEQQHASLTNNITYLKGALENQDYVISIQGGAQDNADNSSYLESLISKARAGTVSPPVALTVPSGT
jgi:hypothetical protein